ncbi:hypothetical protein MLD38_000383 [Melastoma candidum]|uniref:Uncharacterized protein n=1 Tax=Melastoma candidum TaxID=119954 RepID=A0ACB9S984_9MYRT|nr:hypothetical protein MLD38_000383 [Melastoma candidum]
MRCFLRFIEDEEKVSRSFLVGPGLPPRAQTVRGHIVLWTCMPRPGYAANVQELRGRGKFSLSLSRVCRNCPFGCAANVGFLSGIRILSGLGFLSN